MSASKKYSLRDLFFEIQKSARLGEKRDFYTDLENYLELGNLKYKIEYKQKKIPDRPTIFAANHSHRPIWQSFSIGTTKESLDTSLLISYAAEKFNDRQIKWLVKKDLTTIPYLSPRRYVQIAAIDCYDFIPVIKGNGPIARSLSVDALKKGFNLGIFPEGRTSRNLKNPHPNFYKLFVDLELNKIRYQVVPVGVYTRNSTFYLKFSDVIKPKGKDPDALVLEIMLKIASCLPPSLRGQYNSN